MSGEVGKELPVEEAGSGTKVERGPRGGGWRRWLKLTCLGGALMVCGVCGGLGVALQGGPMELGLVGGNTLRVGSEDFVLSDYSFKQGTTHALDFEGNGVRTMVQFQYVEESRTWELVWHQASRERIWEKKLLSWRGP